MSRKRNKFRFSAKKPEKTTKNQFIPTTPGYYDRNPEFSFKYYEHEHAEYSARCIIDCGDFHVMFERLKAISQLKWKDIKQGNGARIFHFHPINWRETSEPNGFKRLPVQMRESPPWQFKLFGECRAVGFFNKDNIFELIWLDRLHRVYSVR